MKMKSDRAPTLLQPQLKTYVLFGVRWCNPNQGSSRPDDAVVGQAVSVTRGLMTAKALHTRQFSYQPSPHVANYLT